MIARTNRLYPRQSTNPLSLRLGVSVGLATLLWSSSALCDFASTGITTQASAFTTLAALEAPSDSTRSPKADSVTKHLVLVMVGDTGFAPSRAAPHPNRVVKYGNVLSFDETLEHIRHDIDGDINFANMESVISASTNLRPTPKKYNFVTHPNGVRTLVDAGFNLFSLANNHAYDYGSAGVRETLLNTEPLKDHGLLAYAGVGNSRQEAAHVPVFSVKSMQVAFGSIGIGGGGAGRATKSKPGQLSLYSRADKSLLSRNLRRAKADIRLLSVHHGPERHIRPSAHEISFQRKLVMDSDANVMLGHHAHVARGIEMIDGRLIVYGLGNFNHQGTANMNGKGGCHDYSLMIKVHFIQKPGKTPTIAAVEALPINSTHMQPRRVTGKQGARRIAVLNGLSAQFDNPHINATGVRFMAQSDGSGLFCTKDAQSHPATQHLCVNYSAQRLASAGQYHRAVASCGRSAPLNMIAKAPELSNTARTELASLEPAHAIAALPFVPHEDEKPTQVLAPGLTLLGMKSAQASVMVDRKEEMPINASQAPAKTIEVAYQLERNPSHWPAGMPKAWIAPSNEDAGERAKRWKARRYTVAEVESLLKKRGLIK